MDSTGPLPADGAQSLRRAFTLLTALARTHGDGGSVAELAALTGLNRSTAHRMLKALHALGMLRYAAESHRYFLGPLAYEIGRAASGQVRLRRICAQVLPRLAAATGDTVFLAERERFDSVCIDRAEGHYPVKTLVMAVGERRPLGVGAASLAILAALPDDAAEEAIAHNADRISAYAGMTLQKLRRHLAEARQRGIASLPAVGVPEVRAVGVALRAPGGLPLGALSIAAVGQRMDDRRLARHVALLEAEARAIAQALSSV